MNQQKSILAVGSIALDSLITPKGNRENILGGSASYFSISASYFAPVSLVGVVGNDFPKSGIELFESHKIDITNLEIHEGKTFRWSGEYSRDYNARETLSTELGVFENYMPTIQKTYKTHPFVFLGNIQPELQMSVIKQISNSEMIICDTMNLWIDLCLPELKEVLKKIDVFLLNDEEAIQITGEQNLIKASDKLQQFGPKTVVVKQGASGALLSHGNEKIQVPVVPDIDVFDPTGAGDSFAGGFVGHLAKHGTNDLLKAVITGASVASFTVSDFGLDGLLQTDLEQIKKRCKTIEKLL
ncbi:MAG: sugar kinase [Candidatus Marinimicrobia bacterium]|nr:sugar kinase [Candidatus Neomarinimicrobiota bacterium]MBL7022937.1 sugar kinase [Candidatus Neomarinimicrobiota bacterium]MBL7108755.1 sugar kinase [Candidatus Neomarinimicrobiota bacterium]